MLHHGDQHGWHPQEMCRPFPLRQHLQRQSAGPLVGAAGGYVNVTSELLQFGVPVAAPASATLTVFEITDVDGDGVFDTTHPNGNGRGDVFTIFDTADCSCEQIIAAQGLGDGHVKFGCSIGAMRDWAALVGP